MYSNMLVLSKERGQLCHLEDIALAASCSVDQHDLFITVTCERVLQFVGSEDDIHRQPDNFGKEPQLLDGGNAICIERHQSHLALVTQRIVGGELGNGGGLPYACGTNERRDNG